MNGVTGRLCASDRESIPKARVRSVTANAEGPVGEASEVIRP